MCRAWVARHKKCNRHLDRIPALYYIVCVRACVWRVGDVHSSREAPLCREVEQRRLLVYRRKSIQERLVCAGLCVMNCGAAARRGSDG